MSTHEKNSRRDFLKGAAAGSLALSGACFTHTAAAQVPKKWDLEADIVVIGFGGAGACAAVEAHDAGAKVLILEKQKEATHYSNTRMSGGIFHCPDEGYDKAALQEYARALFSGDNIEWKLEGEQDPEISEGLAQAWAEYCPQTIPFMKKMDPEYNALQKKGSGFGGAAFPNFPGAEASRYNAAFSSYSDTSDFDVASKDLSKAEKMNGEAFFACLKNGVDQRKIQVLYESPAQSLVTNEAGEVIGVMVKHGNQDMAVLAKKAVIITSGGYEYNFAMRKAFLEGSGTKGWAFYGTTANEGDGIAMANAIGAGLMKVGKAASRLIVAVPVYHNGMKLGMISDTVGTLGTVVVNNYGKRFLPENWVTKDPSRYFSYKEAVRFNIMTLDYPNSPSWMIFDEGLRNRRAITAMGISTVGYGYVPWSKDNMDAINKGWILKGDTLAELGEKIKQHEDNRGLMNVADFEQSILQFNTYAENGKDEEFNRPKATMAVLDKPPYYAAPLYAGGPNTKGGLASNAKREVLDWYGKPIPRLYAAGEIASALKFVYQGGGNLTECIVFGRIAGMNAAKLKPWA